MKAFNLLINKRVSYLVTFLLLSLPYCAYGQSPVYSYFYRVYLRDKGDVTTGKFSAKDILSPRAIDRRQKAGIQVPDFRDYPVNRDYINKILLSGLRLHTTSKWMNTALFKSQMDFDIKTLLDLPFVSDVKVVKTPGNKNRYSDKFYFQIVQNDLPPFDRPMTMINGYPMHNSGYDGKNILIAILDGGFLYSDQITSLVDLRSRNGIKMTRDFVKNNESVYNASVHGTAVLSVLAGVIPGTIEGTAPGADYLLLKTEDVESEFPCEEDFWAAGAEYADSLGADIISSSLGYFNFDDPSLNYKYSDLDGNTAFVTKEADIAASKGILVVNSAGNERNLSWKHIIFPSDGDSVVAVGAVDGNNLLSDFSSAGPSSDGRIKPDNVAMGVDLPVQISENSVVRLSGTSFSCPVLSGMAACLMQAVPGVLNTDIIKVLHSCADRYSYPDSLYGYGIPDIVLALTELQHQYTKNPDDGILVYPNPTSGDFEIILFDPPENFIIEIFSLAGKVIYRKDYSGYAGRIIDVTDFQHREQGVYFLKITDASGVRVRKIIKLKN
jgi:serine protease AprX